MDQFIARLMENQAVAMTVILNNYFHDVATATLLSSAVILYILWRQAEKAGRRDDLRALAHAYGPLTLFARVSLAWIIIGGVFRTIFFKYAEFIPSAQKNIIPDLMVKHIVLVSAVIAGAILWRRFLKIAKAELAAEVAESE